MLSQVLSLVLSCALLMPSFRLNNPIQFENPTPSPRPIDTEGITFPITRTDYVGWHVAAYVEDLGYVNNIDINTSDVIMLENELKQYKITYEVVVNCNNACTLGGNAGAYNLSSNSGILFFNERIQKTANEMQNYLNVTNSGSKSANHKFTSATQYQSISINIQTLGGSFNRTVSFPAVPEGNVIKGIYDRFGEFHTHWHQWEAADIEQKTREIEMWIWELTTYRNIPNSSIVTIRQKLNNGDVDGAYNDLQSAVNDALNAQNESTNNAFNNNTAARTNFNTSASSEKQISTQTESQFNTAIGQIDTTSPVSGLTDFARSATWVRDRFDELTTNTAFGTLLGFSLLLGLALAIVGRLL